MGFQYYVPTRILFGSGQLNKLSKKRLQGFYQAGCDGGRTGGTGQWL